MQTGHAAYMETANYLAILAYYASSICYDNRSLMCSSQLISMHGHYPPLKVLPSAYSGARRSNTETEDSVMVLALQITERGVLRPFSGYAGKPGGSAAAVNVWEYSMLMQRTQFAPAPAGMSAEQYRIWEALEAGARLHPPHHAEHMRVLEVSSSVRHSSWCSLGPWQEIL